MENDQKTPPVKKVVPVRSRAWQEGFDAAYKKKPAIHPYPPASQEAADWGDGYLAGLD